MNFSRLTILLSSEMSADILMRGRTRSARDVERVSGSRSRSRALSVHRRDTRIWGFLIGTERCGSKRGGMPVTWYWSVSGRGRCSRRSTCSSCGGYSARGCCALPCVQTATHTPQFINRSVSHLCPCQGRVPSCWSRSEYYHLSTALRCLICKIIYFLIVCKITTYSNAMTTFIVKFHFEKFKRN